jgi:nucleolar protein 15
MSSTAAVKKAKTVARAKTKRSQAEHDATPASPSKGHKPKLTKREGEEHAHKTKSKPVREEGTKRTTTSAAADDEETRHKTVSDTRNDPKRAARPERKLRGPWRAPSPSPSPSPTSDLEPSFSKEDEPEVPQEEDGADEENVHLYGFSTDEDDSSDDDLDVDDEAVLDVGSLPTVARDDAAVKRKLERAKRNPVRVSSPYAPRAVNHDSLRYTRSAGIRNGCSLSEPDSPRLLRGSNAHVLLPVRRDIARPPLAE